MSLVKSAPKTQTAIGHMTEFRKKKIHCVPYKGLSCTPCKQRVFPAHVEPVPPLKYQELSPTDYAGSMRGYDPGNRILPLK